VDTWQRVSEFREKSFREITECKGKSSRSKSGPLDPEEHVVEIRVFGGKVPRRKIGEVKTKRSKREVAKSIGVVDLRKTCWVCVIFFARVVVSERLRRARRGVRGGVQGFGGSAPEKFFLGRHIFAGFRPTYYRRADIFPGRHISGTT
jgi:hypothetical protein